MEPVDMALVERYSHRPDWATYVSLIRTASAAGNDWATYVLATWFLRGFPDGGIAVNRPRALDLLKKSARSSAHAMVELAHCYEDATGITRSPARARALLEKAARFGSVFALFHLAWIYGEGVGVHANARKANGLVKRAARLGFSIDNKGDLAFEAVSPENKVRRVAKKGFRRRANSPK
ncbi:MAG: hypothetical protein ABI467_01300 [Kofleriaceae bacterium]